VTDKASFADGVALLRHKRRMRTVRFIVAETIAIAVMIASALAGVSVRFAAENLTPIFRVIPVTAAAVAVILPILFFGNLKRRNRRRVGAAKGAAD
jgi:hypothetical protein